LRDSPRQVAFAKLAMLAHGADIYDNPEHAQVANEYKWRSLSCVSYCGAQAKDVATIVLP